MEFVKKKIEVAPKGTKNVSRKWCGHMLRRPSDAIKSHVE